MKLNTWNKFCWLLMAMVMTTFTIHTQATEPTSPQLGKAACEVLATKNFLDIPDASTRINSAVIVPASGDVPEYCKVVAYVAPQVGVLLALPTHTWNGRLLMQGCGGTCGVASTIACEDAMARDYAVVHTDMGHQASPIVGSSWAEHNLQGVIDFGYRGTHVALVAAKVIQAAFYGTPAKYTYYRGCSTGGRQGMVEAQRFPEDFNGIIAIAPPLHEVGDTTFHLVWSARAATDRSGRKIIDAEDVKRVHAAVMAACDGNDGVVDGVIQDPGSCKWKVTELACKDGASLAKDGKACLIPEKVEAFRKIYAGAYNAAGLKLFAGGMPLGSELGWFPYFVAPGGEPAKILSPTWLVSEFLRYLAFYDSPTKNFGVFDFDYEHDSPRVNLMEPFYNAQNPDLRPYKARGGKLILMHGYADPLIPPALTIDYYETATRTMGGPGKTLDFFRLFMVPGMEHCIGGNAADAMDTLTVLENWVEKGIAPDQVLSYRVTKEPQTMLNNMRFPIKSPQWDWARPIYPYPDVAVWGGKGDWKDPATWVRKSGKMSDGY